MGHSCPSAPTASPRRRLPILRCLARAYGLLVGNPGAFLRAAAVPFALSLLIGMILHQLVPVSAQTPEGAAGTTILLLAFFGYLPLLLFFVAWTRFALLGEVLAAPRLLPRIAGHHGRVLLFSLLLGLAFAATFLLLSTTMIGVGSLLTLFLPAGFSDDTVAQAFGAWSGLLSGLVTLYLFCRFAFLLAAAALDQNIGIKAAWRSTRRQGLWWLLGIGLALAPVMALALLTEVLLTALATSGAGPDGVLTADGIAAQVLRIALQYLMTGALVGFIAYAFEAARELQELEEVPS